MGVDAIGVNFWPRSKRYLPEENAGWLPALAGRILRVGVFVNQPPEQAIHLVREGWIDVVQLHGDETPADAAIYQKNRIPFFKAFGVGSPVDLADAASFGADAILLDAHAPGTYGGTGAAFDWNTAVDFKTRNPEIPVLLAGGIVPENAAAAVAMVRPAAIDVASGAEHSPGLKDFDKVARLLAAIQS